MSHFFFFYPFKFTCNVKHLQGMLVPVITYVTADIKTRFLTILSSGDHKNAACHVTAKTDLSIALECGRREKNTFLSCG